MDLLFLLQNTTISLASLLINIILHLFKLGYNKFRVDAMGLRGKKMIIYIG